MERKELLDLLQRCGHHLHHQKGKKFGQYRILLILEHHPPHMSQKELLECLHIQAGSLSEILMKMEMSKLVKRSKDPLDKRRVLLELTYAGHEIVKTLIKEYESENEKLFASLSDEECSLLYELLARLYASWKGENYA